MRDKLPMRKTRNRILVWLAGIALCASATSAAAQSGGASELRLTLYFWIAGFEGTVGASDGGGREDANFSNVFDDLQLSGYMLNADWRKGRWTVLGDWSHFSVSSSAPSPLGALYAGVDAEISGNVVQGSVGYRIVGDFESGLDVLAGLRYYDIDASMTLLAGQASERNLSGSARWTDGVIGARWRGRMNRRWTYSVYGDVGTGGSNFTWQAAATISYEFSWGSVAGGWRHLYVDYDSGGLKLDVTLGGPFVGATLRF